MNNTKEKILQTALVLFNTKGLAKVTLRTIANKMGISQGNLNYHFKKRAAIIEALYFQLVQNIDNSLIDTHQNNVLAVLFHISNTIMHNFYNYRFFLLDFVQIMRENDTIKSHYEILTKQRELQFERLFDELVNQNIMRKEILPNEYRFLYKRFQILGDFWISSAVTENQVLTQNSIEVYSEILSQAIYPYLTEKGSDMYFILLAEKKD